MLTAMLCLFALPLAAQQVEPVKVTHIYFSSEGGAGRAKRHVNIHEIGKVEISAERCAGCRWHAPFSHEFTVSANDFREIAALFDVDALQRASSAPCTMETAGQGRMQEYIAVSRNTDSRSFQFVQSCTSPELIIVRDQMAIANRILQKAAALTPGQEGF